MLWVRSIIIVFFQSLFEVLKGFQLELLFGCWEKDPSLQANGISITPTCSVYDLLAVLTSSFELLNVPQEAGSNEKILVGGHFFSVVHFKIVSVNGFLIHISASLMIMNHRNGCCQWNFSTVLHPGQFSQRFRDIAFFEDTKRLPESEHWVLTLLELIVTELSDRAPKLFSYKVVNRNQNLIHFWSIFLKLANSNLSNLKNYELT